MRWWRSTRVMGASCMKCSSVCLNKSKRSHGIHFSHSSNDRHTTKEMKSSILVEKMVWERIRFLLCLLDIKCRGMSFNGGKTRQYFSLWHCWATESGMAEARSEEKRSQFDLHLFKNIFIPGMTEHLSIMNSNSIFHFLLNTTRATSKDSRNGRRWRRQG